MKYVIKMWRALFAGLSLRDAQAENGLVRMFEVEYAKEARQMRKLNGGPISPLHVELFLQTHKGKI